MIARTKPALFAVASLLAAGLVPAGASCAISEMGAEAPPDAMPLPSSDSGASDAPEGAPEPDCDASADDCVSTPLACDVADFCPVPTPLSPFLALVAVAGSGPNDVWAVGSGGTALHWDGATWTTTTTNVKETLSAIWVAAPNDVWLAADTNTILRTTGVSGGAATFTRAPAPDGVFGTLVNVMWGAGSELHLGTLPFFVDEDELSGLGSLITKVSPPDGGAYGWRGRIVPGGIHGIWGSSADDVWAVGEQGTTLHGTRTGAKDLHTWVEVDSQSRATLGGVWGSGPSDVWTVGDGGTIRHIRAGEPTWEIVPSPVNVKLRKIWGSGAKDVWAVGDVGTILHYDGTGWKEATAAFPIGRKPRLYGVWGSSASDMWIVGDGIVLRGTWKAGGGS